MGWLGDHALRGFPCGLAIGPISSAFDVTVIERGRGTRKATPGGIALGYVLAGTTTGVISAALLLGARHGLPTGLVAGTAVGAVGGVAAAWEAARHLATSGRPTSAVERTMTPEDDWREGTRRSRRFGLLLGATVGTTVAFVSWWAGTPAQGVIGTALAGLAVMPFTVLALSPRTKTTLTALLLWQQRRSPVRVVRFLEEPRERNVLRVVGPVYQFRHAWPGIRRRRRSSAAPARRSWPAGPAAHPSRRTPVTCLVANGSKSTCPRCRTTAEGDERLSVRCRRWPGHRAYCTSWV